MNWKLEKKIETILFRIQNREDLLEHSGKTWRSNKTSNPSDSSERPPVNTG